MFREAFAKCRCLVPAPVYYQWRDDPEGKTPFAAARENGEPIAFGGIWEPWKSPEGERLQTLATIEEANRLLGRIQDRMPVNIERQDWSVWLGRAEGDVSGLLRSASEDALGFWSVDRGVQGPLPERASLTPKASRLVRRTSPAERCRRNPHFSQL
jgi:putative SOS response-associated peptidase YedK